MRDDRGTICGPLLLLGALVCLAACGDGSSGRTGATPTATPAATPGASPSPGPVGGRVFTISLATDIEPFGLAVARSENAGGDLVRVFESDAFGPESLGLAFVDASRGWAIGGRSGEQAHILRTIDGGQSWVSQTENIIVEDESLVRLFDIAFSSAERGVAVGVVRQALALSAPPVILLTIDGGEEWRSVLEFSRPADLQSVCLTASGTGLAVGSSLVLRTDDGGATWREITTELALSSEAASHTVACTETGQFWIGGKRLRRPRPGLSIPVATVLFSPDNGGTWEDRSPPSLADFGETVVSLDFVDAMNGWALAEDHTTVFHTDDAGATWVEQALPVDAPSRLLAVDFRDSQQGVVVGGEVGTGSEPNRALAFVTADGGSTWARGSVAPDDTLGLLDVAFPSEE